MSWSTYLKVNKIVVTIFVKYESDPWTCSKTDKASGWNKNFKIYKRRNAEIHKLVNAVETITKRLSVQKDTVCSWSRGGCRQEVQDKMARPKHTDGRIREETRRWKETFTGIKFRWGQDVKEEVLLSVTRIFRSATQDYNEMFFRNFSQLLLKRVVNSALNIPRPSHYQCILPNTLLTTNNQWI